MEHSHRLTDTGTTARRTTAKAWTATLSLLLMLFAANALRAQNPAYSFASRIGSTNEEVGHAIALDDSGNMYVTGWFQGTVDFDPGPGTVNLTSVTPIVDGGGTDIFVASYDASGNYRWAFNVGGPHSPTVSPANSDYGRAIAVDDSGNVVVSGLFIGTVDFNPGTGTANLVTDGLATFVARYSSTGSYLWAFKIGTYSSHNDVALDANGNVVVVGNFRGTVDFNPGLGTANLSSVNATRKNSASNTSDIFVAKYSSSGAYQWAFRVGNEFYESADAVDVDGNGNIYVTGVFNNSTGATSTSTVDFNPGAGTANLSGPGLYVARYSSAGTYLSAFKIGGTNAGFPGTGYHIAVDGNGNVAVAGGFNGTVDFNPGTGTANLTGVATSGSYAIFVARYSSTGSYQSAFTPSVGEPYGMSIDGNDDLHLTGFFNGTNDFDPGTGTASLATDSTQGSGAFVASYNSSGDYRWAFSIPTVATRSRGIASNGSGDIYLTGSINIRTADFDPSDDTANLTSVGRSDIFIAKYSDAPPLKRAIESNTTSNALQMSVAPNPFTSGFSFHHDGTAARIEVVDMLGRMVESRDIDGATEVTLGEELPTGAYIVRMTQGDVRRQVMVRKVR